MAQHSAQDIMRRAQEDHDREKAARDAAEKRINESKAKHEEAERARNEPLRARYVSQFDLVMSNPGIIDEATYRRTRQLLKELRKDPYAWGYVNGCIALAGGLKELMRQLADHAVLYD